MEAESRRWPSWLEWGAILAFALTLQGARGLFEPDEGRYVDVALQMLRLNDWFTPHLHHEVPHFSKPPLTYWAVGSSLVVFGNSEAAARLPNSLAFAGTAVAVGCLASLWGFSRRAATWIYATSLLPFVAANIVTTDTLLTFFEVAAVLGFARYEWQGWRFGRFTMWLAFGLAFLTKGPPGLLPLAAIAVFVVWRRGVRGLVALVGPIELLSFSLLAFGWYSVQALERPDLLRYLLGAEVKGRVAGAFDRNAGLFGLLRAYGPTALFALFPWILIPVAALFRRSQGKPDSAVGAASHPDAGRFLALWLSIPLLVFCFSSSRLPLYLVPLAAPGVLWIARSLPPDGFRRRRRLLAAWAIALLALRGASAFATSPRNGRAFARKLSALLPAPPRELAFVGKRPLFTQAFYLDCEVEWLVLDQVGSRPHEPSYRPLADRLVEEIASAHEEPRYFVVPRRLVAAFEEVFVQEGKRVTRHGQVDDWSVYSQVHE